MKRPRTISHILILSGIAPAVVAAQGETKLVPGQPIEAELAPGATHTYLLDVPANTFVLGDVDQISVDVVVTVIGPDERRIGRFDGPGRGPEPFSFMTGDMGTHRIEITPFREQTGRYVMQLVRVEAAATTEKGQVDQLMAIYDRLDAPGCVCAVMQEGELVHAKGYGMANLDYDVPLTPESVFYIASTSKQFTAASIALLVLDGTIGLDDDIRMHLPELFDFGSPITIGHLIHHTSGLRDYLDLLRLKGWRDTDSFDNDMVVELLAQQRELNFEPGTESVYSNSGYVLLAEIIKRVSGQSLRMFAEERLFRPLGMVHTHFEDDHGDVVKHRVSGYALARGEYHWLPRGLYSHGDGSLLTTVGDLHRWDRNFYDPQIGGSPLIDLLLTRGVLTNGDTLGYAFGLVHGTYRGLPIVSHGGSWKGFQTQLLRFPQQRFSVAVLCNVASANPNRLSRQVAGIYLSEQFMEPGYEEAATTDPEREAVEIDRDLLNDYIGEYERQPGVSIIIGEEDNRLYFYQFIGQRWFETLASSDSTFFSTTSDAALTFHRDPDGEVSYLTLHQGGDTVARRLQPYEPTIEDLSAYAGRYYSSELETTTRLVVEHGKLVVKRQQHEDIELKPVERDWFRGAGVFSEVVFQRHEADQITGLRVSSGRVRNLLFERQR